MSPNRDESRTQGGDGELPGYTTRSTGQLAEHSFTLEDGKSRTWIWLSVRSRANSSRQLPLYFEGDMIGGTVSVDFSLTSGVKGVSLTVGVLDCKIKSPGCSPFDQNRTS